MDRSTAPSIPRLSETAFAESVLAIATSRSLDALGAAFHTEISRLIGSQSVGFYALADGRPQLILSWNTPEGFLRDYEARTHSGDILIDRMQDGTRSVDGCTELGLTDWHRSGSFDLLRRWGYAHCLGGPLCIDGRLLGIVYTASTDRARPYGPKLLERMDILCGAGVIALGAMIENGVIDAEPGAWVAQPCKSTATTTSLTPGASVRVSDLPQRLRDVVALVVCGRTNKEIARTLGLSTHTVKEYVSSLCKRMKARNRTELVCRMIEQRW